MRNLQVWLTDGLVLALGACASMTEYEPIIDTQGVNATGPAGLS